MSDEEFAAQVAESVRDGLTGVLGVLAVFAAAVVMVWLADCCVRWWKSPPF